MRFAVFHLLGEPRSQSAEQPVDKTGERPRTWWIKANNKHIFCSDVSVGNFGLTFSSDVPFIVEICPSGKLK